MLMLDQFMKTLSNVKDQSELLRRLAKVRRDSPPRFGTMTAHQMICHLSDSFRSSLGEKIVSPSTNLFKRTIYKWIALWVPMRWPAGVRTRPEMDQRLGGTRPVDFDSDLADLRILFEQFCHWKGPFAPHAILGPLSRTERMRHAYLHIDHHLRQFGA